MGRVTGRMLTELGPTLPEDKLLELAFKVDRHVVPRHLSFDADVFERMTYNQKSLPPTRNTIERLAALAPGSALSKTGSGVRYKTKDGRVNAHAYNLRRGGLCVAFFGTINWHLAHFHTADCLFPVGYTAYRSYFDVLSPFRPAMYMCRIREEEERPLFEVRQQNRGLLRLCPSPEKRCRFSYSYHSLSFLSNMTLCCCRLSAFPIGSQSPKASAFTAVPRQTRCGNRSTPMLKLPERRRRV